MTNLLSCAEDAALAVVSPVLFAVVDTIEAWKVDGSHIQRKAEEERRKGVGPHRERHLERANRLQEIGWEERVNQQREGMGR